MSRKRKLRDDQEPFLVQHHPLTSDQLCDLLGAQEDEVMEAVVSQVSEPKAGQVFLVDCAGARFARYDYHRWTAFYHHNGLGPLLPPSTPDPLKDWMEVRYNKKLGSHGHLGQGAIRIVYKLKSEERHMVEAPGVAVAPFRIIHYLEKLPAQVESSITQHLEEEDAQMRLQEENQRKEREAEEKRKEMEGAQKGESKFGRRRKPNSRYSELYSLEAIRGKAASGDSQSDEEPAEAEPSRGMSTFLKMPGMKANGKGQRRGGRIVRGGPSRSFRDTSGCTWLDAYGLERTKPKSSALFRMCDDDDDDDDGDGDSEGDDGDGGGGGDGVKGGSDENESIEEEEEEEEDEEEEEQEEEEKEEEEDDGMKNEDGADMVDFPQLLGYAIDLSPQAGDSPTTDEVKITITHSDPSNPICSDASNPLSMSPQSSEVLTGADSNAIPTTIPTEEPCKSTSEGSGTEGVLPRRRKCLGRPRYRGLQKLPLKRKKGEKEDEEEKMEGEKDEEIEMDYSPDEARPYKLHEGRLFHADAEDIFRQAVKGDIEVHRLGVKTPKAGALYVLDKGFVPFSDSLPWLREYYYRSHSVLMERFTLRETPRQPHPTAKTLFTYSTPNTTLCIVHYEKPEKNHTQVEKGKLKTKKGNKKKKDKMNIKPGIYTESNSNLNLSLVEAMLTRPDPSRLVSAPVLNPQPFQVYLLSVPAHNTSKVLDNYCWTDKGFKRWPTDSSGSATRLLCYHSPMKITRNAMCTALMRHEFRLPSPDTQDVRVVHYMPTREFREYVVIANAAKQMQKVTEAVWHDPPVAEDVAPLQTSSSRLRPGVVWELLTQGNASCVILVPQAGGVYLTSHCDSPDILEWEDMAQLQIQPRMYQVLEVCQRVTGDRPRLIRLCYTSRKVPYKVLVHYLGDTRPYVNLSVNVLTAADDDDTPAGKQQEQGEQGTGLKQKEDEVEEKGGKEETEKISIAQSYLRNDQLYKISPHHLREVGCVALKPEDLDVEVEATFQQSSNQLEETLIPPDKPGLYHYGHRMMKKRIIRLLENLDRSRKTQLPIKNPEAGEAYLVTKPTNKTVMDPYKWTQKGWTPIPRKDPVVLWRWGLLRHKKHAWAPPLIRIDYVHLHVNTDLMLLHYVPTKDNENMLEIRSAIVPLRTETHTLLSMGDVNFGQHSQLLTNSPLPPSHIWELLSAGGGLTQPITEPQPGGVYVTNMDSKDRLDLYSWKVLGDIRLSCNDYGLLETSALVEWGSGEVRLGRLTYHTPLIRARTVIHYMGDCRPYLDRAKNEEQERLKRLEVIAKVTNSAATLDLTHLEVSTNLGSARGDGVGRDPATEAVGSILAGLGSNIMDSDTLNQTFAELGGEVEGLCDGSPSTTSPAVTRLEDQHLQDSTLPPIQVAYGSISTTALVNQLFPEGLPKITVQKILSPITFIPHEILEVEEGEVGPLRKRRTEQHLLELPEMKNDTKDEERRMLRGPYRAIPRTLQDWNEEEECDDGGDGSCEGQRKTRLEITTTESRTIVYIRQHHTLTEKQLDHFLCNPDVSRVSFLPLIDPQPGDVYVVAIPYRKGEVRRLDCHDWYVTGHKKGKFRRTYSYIKDQEGNTSHRLLRYTYDYAWEDSPGLRVVHYIPGDPRHQVLCCGKKPNYEEEPEGKGSGPLYRAYTASMTYRDVLLIMNDPPLYHVCELPIHDPKAGDVYIIKAPSLALAQRESMYDNLIWTEGQVKNVGGKRPALRKTKYLSFDPTDGTRSDAFVRVTWERLLDPSEVTAQLGGGHRRQPLVIIHYLGDETMAGEMMRRGKDGTLHLRQIQHYMETGSYLPSVHITEKNSIRKSAKKFTIENNILYYISKSQREMRRVLYTNEEKNKAFEECHIMPKTGEHCGRTKTLKRLSEKYYWTNMVEDLVAMIVRCKACEFNKLNRPNQRFVRVTEPWEVVSIDIIGQFVASSCGNNFVAVIIDMFTKYTVVVPLRDTTVSDVTSALETAVFLQGPPRKFISDQCEEFVQELSLELDMRLGVNVVAVSKTQMNRPEEANIKTSILHHCLEADADWKDQLQKKVYEINTEYMTTSGYTPFYLMFHREPRPIDGSLSLRVNSNSKPTFLVRDIEPYMEERDQRASEIINQVLTGQPATERTKVYLEEAGASAREAGDILNGVLEEGGGSVYEMGDGEGHVVVVAGGVAGLEGGGDGGEEEGQHMVVVQPGVGDQGVIMLAENQVIMEAVAGQQFTYLPSS